MCYSRCAWRVVLGLVLVLVREPQQWSAGFREAGGKGGVRELEL